MIRGTSVVPALLLLGLALTGVSSVETTDGIKSGPASEYEVGAPGGPQQAGEESGPQVVSVDQPPPHHLTKRNFPRWYQAYTYKTPNYGSWRNSQRSERKRFLPFHPLARFRGLSSGSRGSSGDRSSGRAPSSDSRWDNGMRGGIPPFSDVLRADIPRHPLQADNQFLPGDSDDNELTDGGVADAVMGEILRGRLAAATDARPLQQHATDDEEVKAGELLKYLLAVNGNRNIGSSLRFGFTK